MPGIFGVVTLNPTNQLTENYSSSVLSTMGRCLKHRDDYVLDRFISTSHGLAIGRYSNSSTMNIRWPKIETTSKFDPKVLFHGIIFEDSTDVFSLKRIEELQMDPEKLLNGINGYFSLMMFNGSRNTIIISVDRRASEPIFYFQTKDMIYFAPEVKALLAVYPQDLELNAEGISMFLACGHLLGDQTMISSIKRLPGGCYLKIQNNQLVQKSYWSFRPGSEVGRETEGMLKEELAELLKIAVRNNLGNPQKTAIFLSGGVDSRGILAGALTSLGGKSKDLNTISWGIDEEVNGSDPNIAKKLAQKLHLNHIFLPRLTNRYADDFEETNYIVDGLSDIAAFHPYEYSIMKQIKNSGIDRVLRGDEVFGWKERAYSHIQAEAEVGIRPLQVLPFYAKLLHQKFYSLWSDGSDLAISKLRSEIKGMEPNDAKDYIYFVHRLQGYLHTSAYYKQVHLDHRNVLLEDSILKFLTRVPWELRIDKRLFRKTIYEMNPDLWTIPIANRTGYENWGNEMVEPSPLREYLLMQINDTQSGVWEYFNKTAMLNFFNSLSFTPPSLSSQNERKLEFFKNRIRGRAKKTFFSFLPQLASDIRSKRLQREILPHHVLLRFLVFKNWHDQFISMRKR